jgi:glycosyltransferase involved in cell wall biosynthesis
MRISVVVPAYQAEDTIARALSSIVRQSLRPDEIIVVNDGSTDGTLRVLQEWAGSVRVIHVENGGASRARNIGVAAASGDLVAFLDADDAWEPWALERRAAAFARHPDLAVVAGAWRWLSDGGTDNRATGGMHLRDDEWGRPLRGRGDAIFRYAFAMSTSTVLVRRDLLTMLRFDEDLITAEDRDLWIRLAADGLVWFDASVLAILTERPESVSERDIHRDCTNMLLVLQRYSGLVHARARRAFEARLYRQWAGRLLATGASAEALPFAWSGLVRAPWSPAAWWILAKCGLRSWKPSR